MSRSPQTTPDALLLLAPDCPHCPAMLESLGELLKQGVIGRLEAVNVATHPERAEKMGVRGVPWLRLGEFELHGLHSLDELRRWAGLSGTARGLAEYYAELLKQGQLARVLDAIRRRPQQLPALLQLAADPDTELTVRIGISAVMEDLQATDALRRHLDALIELSRHPDPRVRSDASHFLALTRSADARAALEALTHDPERAVREVAGEALEELVDAL